jgi:hypothetical protein
MKKTRSKKSRDTVPLSDSNARNKSTKEMGSLIICFSSVSLADCTTFTDSNARSKSRKGNGQT